MSFWIWIYTVEIVSFVLTSQEPFSWSHSRKRLIMSVIYLYLLLSHVLDHPENIPSSFLCFIVIHLIEIKLLLLFENSLVVIVWLFLSNKSI